MRETILEAETSDVEEPGFGCVLGAGKNILGYLVEDVLW